MNLAIRSKETVKTLLTLGLLTIPTLSSAVEPICPGGSAPQPSVIFCEDWDSGTPPSNFPDSEGTTFNGWTARNEGRPNGHGYMDTSLVHSAPRSLRQLREANGNFVPAIEKSFPGTTQIRVRFYVYLKSPYGNYGGGGESYVHLIFFNTDASLTGQRLDLQPYANKTGSANIPYVYAWPPTCLNNSGGTNGYFVLDSPQGQPGQPFKGVSQGRSDLCFNIKTNYDQWILVEFSHDTAAAKANLWINGTQVMNDEPLPAQVGYETYRSIILSGYWSTVTSTPAELYIDDIVVSNNASFVIGPRGTGDIVPPAAPQNVRIQ